jgi:hypothetical protein
MAPLAAGFYSSALVSAVGLVLLMHYAAKFSSHGQVPRARLARWCVVAALLATLVLPAAGCVRRRLNVRTNPPGALVYVDNQQIGTTPCSVDFIYYGTREIRLIKPGYETLTVNQPIPTPWYQYPGLDFISENLIATKIRDNRTVTYDLAPQVIVPAQQVVDRGNQLRQDAQQCAVVPASAAIPVGPPGPAPLIVPGPTQVAPPPPPGAPTTLQRLPVVEPRPTAAYELLPPPQPQP